jgi:hypothetical protein
LGGGWLWGKKVEGVQWEIFGKGQREIKTSVWIVYVVEKHGRFVGVDVAYP